MAFLANSCWILLLNFCPAESADFADSAADKPMHAQPSALICHPCMRPSPFLGLATAGYSAAAGGSGAVAPSAAAGAGTQRRMRKEGQQSFVAIQRFKILAWGCPQAPGTLRTPS
jgi:hypothetical protein